SGHDCEQENAAHDLNRADHMSIEGLRIHVAVADCGQCLYTEKEAIEKPASAGAARNTLTIQTVKRREQQVQHDVHCRDKRGELWPPQSKQPLISVARLPGANVDFNKLNLTSLNGNAVVSPFL